MRLHGNTLRWLVTAWAVLLTLHLACGMNAVRASAVAAILRAPVAQESDADSGAKAADDKPANADDKKPDDKPADKPDPAPDKPADKPAPDDVKPPVKPIEPPNDKGIELQAVITVIEGRVQVRLAEDQPWIMAKVGMKLDPGAEIRTGLRSKVRMVIPPDETIDVDRLTTIKVLQARQSAGKRETDIGMKYGRTRYEVEKAGIEHETTIRSPSSTLAVRGTIVTLYDQGPFPPEAYCDRGRVVFTNMNREEIAFGGDRPKGVLGNLDSAAQTAAFETKIDTGVSYARTPIEDRLIVAFPALTGVDLPPFFPPKGILLSSNDASTTRQGSIDFTLTWSGGGADLDLFVISPLGEAVSVAPSPLKISRPDGAATVPSGGMFSGDDTTAFPFGSESVTWKDTFPAGLFSFGVQYVSGTGPAVFQVNVTQTLLGRSPTIHSYTGTLDAQNPIFVPSAVRAGSSQ